MAALLQRQHKHTHSEFGLSGLQRDWRMSAERFRGDTLVLASAALLLKGSGVAKGSTLVVFLKKSSEEALKGSTSLKGSPPKGSGTDGRGVILLKATLEEFRVTGFRVKVP